MAKTASKTSYLEQLRAALQHDTLVSCIYTYEERLIVHKEIARVLNMKDFEIASRMTVPNSVFERQDCRLNSARQTEVLDDGFWRIVEPIKKKEHDC
ncbi:MAG: hypothetical protein V6Z82_02535 [Flavobacteriales bacterium]